MQAIDDYKDMVFDVSRVLSIFETCARCYTDYLNQPTRQKENAYKSMVEQWEVKDVDLIKNKIIGYDPSCRIEKELTGDEPDKDKLKLRLEWTYMRLGMPDEDDSYFPKWNKENFAIPNKDGHGGNKAMYDALTAAKGEQYAFDVMCRLETIAEWANMKIGDVEALLDGLCQWAGYTHQKPQDESQYSKNSSSLAVIPQGQETSQEQPQDTPTIRGTDKEKSVFGGALRKQYMSLQDGCYKWTLSKSLLAYMCGRLYCGDRIREDNSDYSEKYVKGNTQMPAQEVEALFGIDVASNRYSIKAPPRNHYKIDDLF